MVYDFWKDYEKFLSLEQALELDYRLDNVSLKLNVFFQRLILKHIQKEEITFFLAGSCIKSDRFRDLDLIFPNSEDREVINDALNKDYFEYENNSYTYRYKNDIYQLVYREKFENTTLKFLVDSFDFDSTKIAFRCTYNTVKRLLTIEEMDLRIEFIDYINTRVNNLPVVGRNPFVSLQRAIHFLKRGDDVPYKVFLDICSKIAHMQISEDKATLDYLYKLQGNPNKLQNLKEAIKHHIQEENIYKNKA